MKKPIYLQFLHFKNRHQLTSQTIQEMMTEYANSGPDTARSYFMEKYDISEHVFYRCRDFAVICMLVDGKTKQRLLKKAAFNSQEHNKKKSSRKSALHSEKLMQQRAEFFNSFTQSEIEDICHKYAEGVELEKIAHSHDTGVFGIKNLLKKGILLGYVDASTYQAISLRVKLSGKTLDVIFKK